MMVSSVIAIFFFFLPFWLNRKDSFITHRAFCDALAEESARFTSVTAPSLNFRNNDTTVVNTQSGSLHGFGISQGAQDIAGITQLSSILRPDADGVALGGNFLDAIHNERKSRLSLWLNQANSQLANPDQILPDSSLFGSAGATGLSEMLQMGTANNLFRSPSVPNFVGFAQFPGGANGALTANLGLSPLKEEVGSKGNLVEASTSEYDCPSTQPSPAMSATALLQKAAQLGSTRSNPSPIFGNALGVTSFSPIPTTSGLNVLRNQSRTDNDAGKQPVYPITNLKQQRDFASDSNLNSAARSSSILDQAQQKQRQGSNSGEQGSLTRDFLGMGGEAGHPFSPHELASLASMSSAMGLGQFVSNGWSEPSGDR